MHYVSLREFSYIYILKKVLKFIEGGEVEVGRRLTFTSGREVNERKGHFSGTVRSAISFLHLSVSADPTPGPQR